MQKKNKYQSRWLKDDDNCVLRTGFFFFKSKIKLTLKIINEDRELMDCDALVVLKKKKNFSS